MGAFMGKGIVLFGAGKEAEKIYKKNKENIVAMIDNKKNGSWNGIPIITLNEYKNKYEEYHIFIASLKYAKEIKEQLISFGITNYSIPDELFECEDVCHVTDISHDNWPNYLRDLCDKEGMEILEVGSRCVVGSVREYFTCANYTGFDYYAGDNVDVVGDAHQLSEYFDKKFDLIFASAVFEHLAMPWVVALEMIKLLKPNGYIFVETHYSYSSHERPWHFFQFSENALNVLFPEKFGIRCIMKGCSNLIRGEFSEESSSYLQGNLVGGLYCHSEFLGQKVEEVGTELSWDNVKLKDVVGSTQYPKQK